MSSVHFCCLGTRTLDTEHPPYLQVLTYNRFLCSLDYILMLLLTPLWISVLGKKEILYGNYPDENLHARHMKQLLVFAGDVGDKFFEPSTLLCFDKVAVKDRNLDSEFYRSDNSC